MRAVFLAEAGRKRIDAELLKMLAGSDRIPGRELYGRETFSVMPSWVVVSVSNDPPNVNAYDDALRDRVLALPFTHPLELGGKLAFTGGKRLEELRRDAKSALLRGFVAWAVEGLGRVYRAQEIHRAAVVEHHTRQFWQDLDPLTPFWEQLDNGETRLEKGILAGELRTSYLNWCQSEGIHKPLLNQAWGNACRTYGLEKVRIPSGPDKEKSCGSSVNE
ncbi:MAG: hypothetical protein QM758_10735 [Armatimonas sp.]